LARESIPFVEFHVSSAKTPPPPVYRERTNAIADRCAKV